MQDKIYAYLKLQKTGATSNELVERVLKIKGAPPDISEKLIQTAVAGDRRIARDECRYWNIIEKGGTPLSEVEFVLLSLLITDDLERQGAILEVSAQKLKDNKIVDRLHIFLRPAATEGSTVRLPADLAHEMKEGVAGEKAVLSFGSFFGEATLVGYDVQSSINQLNMLPNKSNETIENTSLCLKYLTKKLIPGLQPKAIDDIAGFLKLPVTDAGGTEQKIGVVAEIFSRYLEMLQEQGLSTLEEVVEFQYPVIDYVDFSKYTFDKNFLLSIPQKPGIYKMINKSGEVIYVGKAKNLKARVSSYFWNTAERFQKISDLLNNVYTIEYEETGSELAAMLREYRLIKQYQPKMNQQIEVHERAARYGNLKKFIVILPSSAEGRLDLFFVKEGLPLLMYEIVKDAVNFSEVEGILAKMYYDETLISNIFTDLETGEIDIALSWLETNKDRVNYINMDTVGSKETCLKLLKDYIRDEETLQKKHFRLK